MLEVGVPTGEINDRMENFLTKFDIMANKMIAEDILYDPVHMTGLDLMNKICRFQLPGARRYKPYSLNYTTIGFMEKYIQFLPVNDGLGPMDFSTASKFCYKIGDIDKKKPYVLWTPAEMGDLLFKKGVGGSNSDFNNYDITILGILGILLRHYYDNYQFKAFVEKFYLENNFEYSKNHRLWILNDENLQKLGLDREFVLKLIDMNENQGINYRSTGIPYTFAWRKTLE